MLSWPARIPGATFLAEGVQKKATGALTNLAADNDAKKTAIAAACGIPPLVRLLGSGSTGVQK